MSWLGPGAGGSSGVDDPPVAAWVPGRVLIDDSAGRVEGAATEEEEARGDAGESKEEGQGFINPAV